METETYTILYEIEETHWWFRGRRNILLRQLNTLVSGSKDLTILDVGCGTGMTMEYVGKFGRIMGLDKSSDALNFCRLRGLKNLFQGDACSLPFKDQSYDVLIILDLLEHLDDDIQGLEEFYRVLRHRGKIVIFVPAFQFLWSFQDDISHHKRRYTLKELQSSLVRANFHVIKISYANFFLFPIILFLRKLMKLLKIRAESENRINIKMFNSCLSFLFSQEAKILQNWSFPFGVSVICTAEKD